MDEQVQFATMSNREKYLFDLQGFLVVREFLTPEDVRRLNEAADVNLDKDSKYGQLPPNYQGTALEGEFHSFQETRDMLTWDEPWCQPFRDMIAHPKIIPYLNSMLGRGWKLDQHPTIFTSTVGCGGLALHGSTNAIFNGARFYAYQNGRMRCGLISFQYQLFDLNPGDGGLCVIPGSHKANFACPSDILTCDANRELVHQPVAKAGDLVIFNEATTHGTLPWKCKRDRRALLYRYTPKYMQHAAWMAETNLPDWASELTEAQQAVLEPPYVQRRPLIQDDSVSIDRPRWEN